MPYNTVHLVQPGAMTEEGGVRIILNVDGINIFNYLDTGEGCIAAPGYTGLYARSGSITLGVATEAEVSGPAETRTGDEIKLGVFLDIGSSGFIAQEAVIRYDRHAFEFAGIHSLLSGVHIERIDGDRMGTVKAQLSGDAMVLTENTKVLEFALKALEGSHEAAAGVAYIALTNGLGTMPKDGARLQEGTGRKSRRSGEAATVGR